MVASRHISNILIIITKYMVLRDDMLTAKNNRFANLKIEGDLKLLKIVIIKKSNIFNFIMLLIENIWKLSQDLCIYDCCRIYRETNKTINYFTKKCICNL